MHYQTRQADDERNQHHENFHVDRYSIDTFIDHVGEHQQPRMTGCSFSESYKLVSDIKETDLFYNFGDCMYDFYSLFFNVLISNLSENIEVNEIA
jgi:hypothetical protein